MSPGETRTLRLTYRALAAPQVKTRLTGPGSITVTGQIADGGGDLVDAKPGDNTARFRGALRGTGTGIAPRLYRPAELADLTLATADPLTFTTHGDGTYRGSITATIGSKTDGFYQNAAVELATALPGLRYLDMEPTDPCFPTDEGGHYCDVPGGAMPQNTTRTVELTIVTTELPAAGTVVEFEVLVNVGGEFGTDANPADNRISLAVA